MLNKILKSLIYTTIFLIPIFFLPFTFEVLEFNKLYLLFFLVWSSVIIWLLKMIIKDKKVSLKYSIIDLAIAGFMLVAIISSIFSVDKISSLFGYYGRFSTGLISLLTFGAFYFLIFNNLGNAKAKVIKKQQKIQKTELKESGEGIITVGGIIKALLWSGGVAMFFAYFSLFGIWNKLEKIKPLASLVRNLALRVSPVGATLEALAMFLIVLIGLAILIILGILPSVYSGYKKKNSSNIFLGIFIFLAFFLLLITDFVSVWIILIFNLLALVIFVLRKKTLKKEVHRLILPIALIIISSLFLMLNFKSMVTAFPNFALNRSSGFLSERVMTQGESWSVAGKTAMSGVKSGLIGSGPGTFYYNVSKFRPTTLNQGGLWAVSFERSGNVFAEILVTMGFLGLIGFLLIIGLVFWKIFIPTGGISFRSKKKRKGRLDNGTQLLGIILATLILVQFFYYQTLTLSFLFWLFLALTLGWFSLKTEENDQSFIKTKQFKLKDFVEMALILETVCILLFLVFVVVSFFGIKVYLADAKYVKALNEPDINKKAMILQEAVRLNPKQVRYQMVISKVFLVKAQEELAALKEGESQERIIENLRIARSFADSASILAPNQFNSWQGLADLNQAMASMSQEQEQLINLSIESLRKASVLEPKNPRVYTDIGRLYLLLNQTEEARGEFEKALLKKENYIPAHLSLALMSENDGKKEEAINRLEWLSSRTASNAEVLFQLGRLYYNEDRIDEAISRFITVLRLNSRHSNARYSLAIAFEKQGQINMALEQLNIVLIDNPDNQEIKDRIKKLKTGTSEPEEEMKVPEEEKEEGVLEEIE